MGKENRHRGFSEELVLCIIIFEWSIDESCMNRYNIENATYQTTGSVV